MGDSSGSSRTGSRGKGLMDVGGLTGKSFVEVYEEMETLLSDGIFYLTLLHPDIDLGG